MTWRSWGVTGVLALLTVVGCSKPQGQTAAPAPSGIGKVGYVRMDELMQSHPLYAQLAQTERSMEALSLRSAGDGVAQTGGDLAKQDAALQKELQEASDRTKKLLMDKQKEYGQQENAAIAAALAAGGRAGAGPPVGAGVSATAQQQAVRVNGALAKDLRAYQDTLSKQDQQQAGAFARSVLASADRQYRARATELQQRESEFGLELANKDAGERLQLRTQLANLAMDDNARDDARKKMSALDRAEADQVAAMRNRDEQTLVQLHAQLEDSAKTQIQAGVAKIHAETQAKMNARGKTAQQTVVAQTNVVVPGKMTAASLPPDMRARIDALHKQYQERFDHDTKSTIDQFNKTRDELKKRYDAIHGVDIASQDSARKELAALQAQHDKLYAQIVDQINREVRVLAQSRGVTTVISDVAGPGEGIDLTQAAKKEIESLHE